MVFSFNTPTDWKIWIESALVEAEKVLRPMLLLVCGMLLFNLPITIYKTKLGVAAMVYFVLSWDRSFTRPMDPERHFAAVDASTVVARKTLFFVRHGESTWNATFNRRSNHSWVRFVLQFLPNFVRAVCYEVYLLLSGKLDSWFFDSPLSFVGLQETRDASNFLFRRTNKRSLDDDVRILRGDPGAPRSKLVSSSLRSVVATMSGIFAERLQQRPSNKILVHPSLQELSRNPDALSITPPHGILKASWLEKSRTNFQTIFDSQTDMSLHDGNKSLDSNGLLRMQNFCEFVFSGSVEEDFLIVGGSGLWFQCFFQLFLPNSFSHACKQGQMTHCGIVALDLLRVERPAGPRFMVDPDTVRTVFGGF